MRSIFLKLALYLILLAGAVPLYAQGCAVCRTNAAQSGAQSQRGIRRGIAVLLVPSLVIFSGVIFLAYKHREGGGD